MTQRDAREQLERLRAVLAELEIFLQRHRVVTWSDKLRGLRPETGDRECLPELQKKVRELFGGMGSLSDLWLGRANGHDVEDERSANIELDILRERLWELSAAGRPASED